MIIKVGKVMGYNKEFPRIKSHSPLNPWPHDVTWQIKYVISLLSKGLWPWSLAKWWVTIRGVHQRSHTTLLTRGHMRSLERLNILYLYYRNACIHQSYGEGIPTIKSHDHLSKYLCEITWQIKNIKSHLSQHLLSPNLLGWWYTLRSTHT